MRLLIFCSKHSSTDTLRPANSFDVKGGDLARGLTALGHEVAVAPYLDDGQKLAAYADFAPDAVVSVGSWRDTWPTVVHPRQHGLVVVPAMVSDGWVYPYYAEILNDLPLIIAPSETVARTFRRDGVTKPQILVIKESVDTDFYCPAPTPTAALSWRRRHGIADSDTLLFVAGCEIGSKGGWEVIEAVKRLGRRDIKILAKGWSDNPSTGRDVEFIGASGIADQIIYLRKVYPRETLRLLYWACDIYAAPSRNEGFGRPHVEAQACGRPVITIAASGAGENVIHNQTGLIVPVGQTLYQARDTIYDDYRQSAMDMVFDPPIEIGYVPDVDALAAAIARLADDRPLRQKMGRAARAHAVRHYNPRDIAAKFVDAIAPILPPSVEFAAASGYN